MGRFGASVLAVVLLAQCSAAPTDGASAFVHGDFGGLSLRTLKTNALPYKLVAAALVTHHETDLRRILTGHGFLFPQRIANWNGPQPRFERPLGMVAATVSPLRIDAVTLGCASCHAGVLYDREGNPTGDVWLGLPNTSIDLEAYTQDVYRSLAATTGDPHRLMATADRLFPEMGRIERWALRRVLIPRARRRIAELAKSVGRPAPFSNGGPGRTNGVAALKLQLGMLGRKRADSENGFTSIPELGSRQFRSSLLYDGVYAPPGADRFAVRTRPVNADQLAPIVAFFTVPTMGMHPRAAERAIPQTLEVMRWLTSSYTPPRFPGAIDESLARNGRAIYHRHCAGCHGRYSEGIHDVTLVEFPNKVDDVGTDPRRWQVIDGMLADAIAQTAIARHVSAMPSRGYVAPILSALWATAPYLHNGSVPTLWQLMNPAERPGRFYVGGHKLDFKQVGLHYPAGYEPWSTPELYDTTRPGLSNRGHEREFERISDDEKRTLLEYLKLL